MPIGNPTEWLANVSKTCRQLTEQSIVALRDALDDEIPTNSMLQSAQTVLLIHFETLKNLLPEDFPQSRMNDLGRHIHFCQQGDCIDIAAFDVPDVLEKAERYALEHIPHSPSGDIGDYLHPLYRPRLDREVASAAPDFHGLVLKASVLLGDVFKNKAGVSDDKDAEIGKALKVDDPKIKVMPDLTSDTNRNFQRGTMLLLQGVRAYYRNTHSHGVVEISHRQTVQALVIFSMLTDVLDHSEAVTRD